MLLVYELSLSVINITIIYIELSSFAIHALLKMLGIAII